MKKAITIIFLLAAALTVNGQAMLIRTQQDTLSLTGGTAVYIGPNRVYQTYSIPIPETNLTFYWDSLIRVSDGALYNRVTNDYDTNAYLINWSGSGTDGYVSAKSTAQLVVYGDTVPITCLFSNYNYADTLYFQMAEHTLNSDTTEALPYRLEEIAYYSQDTNLWAYFNVPDTGTGPVWCGPDETYTTLQAAIDAASAGDTILIKSGFIDDGNATLNYAIVLKSLTMQGVGDVVYTGGSGDYGIRIGASNTKIAGIEIRTTGTNGIGWNTGLANVSAEKLYMPSYGTFALWTNGSTALKASKVVFNKSGANTVRSDNTNVTDTISECYIKGSYSYNPVLKSGGKAVFTYNEIRAPYLFRKSMETHILFNDIYGPIVSVLDGAYTGNNYIRKNTINAISTTTLLAHNSSATPTSDWTWYIYDNTFDFGSGNYGGYAISLYGQNAHIYRNLIDGSRTSADVGGIQYDNRNRSRSAKIYYNEILNKTTGTNPPIVIGNESGFVNYSNGTEIVGNICLNSGYYGNSISTRHGVSVFYNDSVTVKYNYSEGSLIGFLHKDSSDCSGSIWAYNIARNNQNNFSFKGSKKVRAYNNTSYNDKFTNHKAIYIIENYGYDADSCEVRNSIFYDASPAGTTVLFELEFDHVGTISDNNVWYSVNNNFSNLATDYATWQGLGYDANSYNTNPNFASTTNLWPVTPTNADGNGLDLGATYEDALLNTTVWPSAINTEAQEFCWDIGAYLISSDDCVLTLTASSDTSICLGVDYLAIASLNADSIYLDSLRWSTTLTGTFTSTDNDTATFNPSEAGSGYLVCSAYWMDQVVKDSTLVTSEFCPDQSYLLAWYPLNGSAEDSTGSYDGTWNGTAAYTEGNDGLAGEFNGSNRIDASRIEHLDSGSREITIAFWVKGNGVKVNASQRLMSYGAFNVPGIEISEVTQGSMALSVRDSVGATSHTIVYDTSKWSHIAYIIKNDSVTRYINGIQYLTKQPTRSWYTTTSILRIGAIRDGTQRYTGLLDDFKIFNKGLTPQQLNNVTGEIQALKYYIDLDGNDDNTGTSPEFAWQNVSKIETYSFSKGDTVLIKGGDFHDYNLDISRTNLYIGSYNNDTLPTIRSVKLTNADTINLYKLKFIGDADRNPILVYYGCDSVVISNCEVDGLSAWELPASKGVEIASLTTPITNITIDSCYVHHNGNSSDRWGGGIGGSGRISNITVTNNTLLDNLDYNIQFGGNLDSSFYAENITIKGNVVKNTAHLYNYELGINVGWASNNTVVDGNYVENVWVGIQSDSHVNKAVIKNNIVVNSYQDNIRILSNEFGNNDSTFIYNNTIYDSTGQSGITFWAYSPSESTNHEVYNNIVYGVRDGFIMIETDMGNLGLSSLDFTADNNIYYGSNNPVFKLDKTSYSTIGGWRAATSQDVNSFNSDPLFTNTVTRDFTVSSESDAVDNGTTVTEVTIDYAGTSRPQSSGYDIGAYEQ